MVDPRISRSAKTAARSSTPNITLARPSLGVLASHTFVTGVLVLETLPTLKRGKFTR